MARVGGGDDASEPESADFVVFQRTLSAVKYVHHGLVGSFFMVRVTVDLYPARRITEAILPLTRVAIVLVHVSA